MANETTTKFKVDISELKSQFQEASRQVRIANSEFKAATAGMDNWAKSADGVSAKTKQLTSVLDAQKAQLQSLEQQYALVAQEQGENSKGAQELLIKINNQKAAIGKTESELRKYQNSLNEINSASQNAGQGTDNFRTASQQLESTIAGQERQLESLKRQYTDVVLVQGKGSDAAHQLESKISALSSELAENKGKLKDAAYGADDLADSVDDAGDSAKNAEGGFTVLKGALASLVADGIKTAISGLKDLATELLTDSSNAYASFAAATGTASDAMGEYKKAIDNVYMDNFGDSLQDVAEKMAKVKEVTGELDASKLQDMTEKAMTLEDVFGMDMVETLRGVNSLMTHFGLTSEQAFDLMASGAQNGLNYTDELGDNVSEYSGKFAEAGFSAEEYFQLLKNGAEGGAYNLDKVNDAVNEVTTRLADGTIEDSLSSFSKGTRDVFKAWKKGEATQKDVMAAIVSDIQNTTNEQEKMNLAALAFGTMAEDGGTKFIEALTPVGDTFDKVKGKADKLAAVKYDTPIAAIQGIGRTLKVELLGPLVQSLMPKLNELASWVAANLPNIVAKVQEIGGKIKELGSFISTISPLIAGVGVALAGLALAGVIQNISSIGTAIKTAVMSTKLATAAQWLWNAAMSANPIGLIVIAIAGLVAAFVVLWNKSEAFRNFWIGLWENIKSITGTVVDALVQFFTETIPTAWNAFLTFVGEFIANIVEWFSQLPEMIGTAISGAITIVSNIFNAIKEAVTTIITAILNAVTTVWNAITSAISNAVNTAKSIITTVWNAIKTTISTILNAIKSTVTTVWNAIKSTITSVVNAIKSTITSVWNAIKSTLTSILNAIKSTVTSIWNAIKSTITSVVNAIKSTIKTVWNAIKSTLTSTLNTIKSTFTTVWNAIKTTVTTVTNAIKSTITTVWNAIKSTITSVMNAIKSTIKSAWSSIKSTITSAVNAIKSAITSAWNNIKSTTSNVFNSIKTVISNALNEAKTAAVNKCQEIFNGMKNAFSNVGSTFMEIGKNVISGIISGIGSMVGALYDSIYSALSGLVDKAKGALGINSPSRVFRDEIGKWIPAGIADGVTKNTKAAITSVKKMTKQLLPETQKQMKLFDGIGVNAGSLSTAKSSINNVGSDKGIQNTPNNSNVSNSYVFNQYNNSPKALSRLEIYRQTRNQLNFAKGV